MASRVGIDLVSVDDVRGALAEHGEHYLGRLFTSTERSDCGDDPVRLAARFAAKEAAVKVLRPGPGRSVPWTDIAVELQDDGHPELVLRGGAARLAAEQGLEDFAVSLSHEAGSACAVVLADAGSRSAGLKDPGGLADG